MDRDQAESVLRDQLPPPLAALGIDNLALAYRLTAGPTDERVGQSRLGGSPDLPGGTPWPTWDAGQHLRKNLDRIERLAAKPNPAAYLERMVADARDRAAAPLRPLDFLAQINLADVPPAADVLPDGLLSFFYDCGTSPWGFDPADAGAARVVYTPSNAMGGLRQTPSLPRPDLARWNAVSVRLAPTLSLPSVVWPAHGKRPAESDQNLWQSARDAVCSADTGDVRHQLLGHADEVQGDMRLQCQLVTNGVYCGDSTGYSDPRRKALEPGAFGWRLLLQVDSDEDGPGWMWGDSGRLYFWIRNQDLAARDFDRAWCVLQCY